MGTEPELAMVASGIIEFLSQTEFSYCYLIIRSQKLTLRQNYDAFRCGNNFRENVQNCPMVPSRCV